jgi:hypothetical protein
VLASFFPYIELWWRKFVKQPGDGTGFFGAARMARVRDDRQHSAYAKEFER